VSLKGYSKPREVVQLPSDIGQSHKAWDVGDNYDESMVWSSNTCYVITKGITIAHDYADWLSINLPRR